MQFKSLLAAVAVFGNFVSAELCDDTEIAKFLPTLPLAAQPVCARLLNEIKIDHTVDLCPCGSLITPEYMNAAADEVKYCQLNHRSNQTIYENWEVCPQPSKEDSDAAAALVTPATTQDCLGYMGEMTLGCVTDDKGVPTDLITCCVKVLQFNGNKCWCDSDFVTAGGVALLASKPLVAQCSQNTQVVIEQPSEECPAAPTAAPTASPTPSPTAGAKWEVAVDGTDIVACAAEKCRINSAADRTVWTNTERPGLTFVDDDAEVVVGEDKFEFSQDTISLAQPRRSYTWGWECTRDC